MRWLRILILILPILTLPLRAFAYDPKAKQIENVPAGGIISTNVQDALNELDTKNSPKHMRFTIINPFAAVTIHNVTELCLVPILDKQIIISRIDVTSETNSTLDWNLKYADTFINQANPVLIAALDTSAGVATITNFNNAIVPAGKCLYVAFDAIPAALPREVCVDITYN